MRSKLAWGRCSEGRKGVRDTLGTMLVRPDIIIGKPDTSEVLLAVEVKAGAVSSEAAEAALKAYMVRQSCPAGMFVTPEEVLFFRNRYTGYDVETIQPIGSCRTSDLLDTIPGRTISERALVQAVEQWIESLETRRDHPWPSTATEAIESCVLPAVIEGVVRATGPRLRRTGW